MKIQSIQKIPFKGTIKISTQKDRDSSQETNYYRTTKKQDSDILKAVINTFKNSNGTKITSEDTLELKQTIEKVTGQKINDIFSKREKSLYIGDSSDTSYNKIYYNDSFLEFPINKITIDLMDPSERLDAAMEIMSKIQKKLSQITNTKVDKRIDPKILQKTSLDPEKYAEIEDCLSQVYEMLNNNPQSPYYKKTTITQNNYQYETLIKNILEVCKIKNSIDATQNNYIKPVYTTADVENIDKINQILSIQKQKN